VPLIPDSHGVSGNISGKYGLNGPNFDGIFSLAGDDWVMVFGLPLGTYRVSEQDGGDGYSAVYKLDGGSERPGFSAEVTESIPSPGHTVTFTNTITKRDFPYGSLTVKKTVDGDTGSSASGRFPLTLERYNSETKEWNPVALDPGSGGNIEGDSGLDKPSADGTFSISAKGEVKVTGLFLGNYRVSEKDGGGAYSTAFQVDADAEQSGLAAEVALDQITTDRTVTFTNTLTNTMTSDKDDGEGIPDTGDNTALGAWIWLLIASVGIATALQRY
jgi:hypothetical protein